MKNGVKLIPFEGDGVLVRVPVEVVKDWNIKAEDQIETDISWVGSDVSVKISKNGEAVTDIPGATVEIPYANRDSQTMLTDEEGNSYTGSVNDAQNAAVIKLEIIQWKSNHKIRQRMVETQKRMIRKETVWKMRRTQGKKSCQNRLRNFFRKMSKTRKRIQMRILTVNIKKRLQLL